MKPYEYTEPGTEATLRIYPSSQPDARVLIQDGGCPALYADVPPSEVPSAALALYEAAGLPVPLTVDCPEHTAGIEYAGSSDRYAYTSRVGSMVAIGWRAIEPKEFTPDEALEFAAHIAVNALAAKADEPDEADVDSLALALHGVKCEAGEECSWSPTIADRENAVAALRWMRDREAKS